MFRTLSPTSSSSDPRSSEANLSKTNSVSYGPGAASGWNWTAMHGFFAWIEALDALVVGVDEPRLEVCLREALRVDRVAVVLAGDVAPPRDEVHDRLVLPPVTVLQLVGLAPCDMPSDLLARGRSRAAGTSESTSLAVVLTVVDAEPRVSRAVADYRPRPGRAS